MKKIIIIFTLITGLWTAQIPKDITGKWIVENIDTSNFAANLPQQQRDVLNEKLIKPFTNAVFNFEGNYHFYLAGKIGNMPQDTYWEYDETSGMIKIKEYNKYESMIMKIIISEKDGNIFFALQETPIILKVHKKVE